MSESKLEPKDHEILTTTSTPLHTKDWYLKWASTLVLMVGMILTAQNIFPLNVIISFVALVGWTIVSIIWNDRALIIVNAVGVSIYANGIVAWLVS